LAETVSICGAANGALDTAPVQPSLLLATTLLV
jgi:hypothetical protein